MLLAVLGHVGCGKTLYMTAYALACHGMGQTIYSNYPINIDSWFVEELNDFDRIRDGLLLGDELWTWMYSRASTKSETKKLINAVLAKSRKRGFDCMFSSQHFLQLDAQIRRTTDVLILPKVNNPKNPTWMRVEFTDLFGKRIKAPIGFDPRPYFKMYDTNYEVATLKGGAADVERMKEILRENRVKKAAEKEGISLDS